MIVYYYQTNYFVIQGFDSLKSCQAAKPSIVNQVDSSYRTFNVASMDCFEVEK